MDVQEQQVLEIAQEILNKILRKFNLLCSIYGTTNKLLVKMTSDMKNRVGITMLIIREVKRVP
ncbi:hypothetical protein ACIQ2D_04830 [Lysinibacillus sp. NPDC097287]|uniref:hypothetical protein n=1 Tax=Lysinibacillus sp. NPDC097287 TaxID=3364144 RepID=UPI00380A25A6